jgi:putative transposase
VKQWRDCGPNRGSDGGKNVKGRKRHITVDTMGLLLGALVTAADVQDKLGLQQLLMRVRDRFDRLEILFVDGGYTSVQLQLWMRRVIGCLLKVVPRPAKQKGFHVLPLRWIVERTFIWLNNYRRLSKDYEFHTNSSGTMVQLVMNSTHAQTTPMIPKQLLMVKHKSDYLFECCTV